jgi:hypothetical protein
LEQAYSRRLSLGLPSALTTTTKMNADPKTTNSSRLCNLLLLALVSAIDALPALQGDSKFISTTELVSTLSTTISSTPTGSPIFATTAGTPQPPTTPFADLESGASDLGNNYVSASYQPFSGPEPSDFTREEPGLGSGGVVGICVGLAVVALFGLIAIAASARRQKANREAVRKPMTGPAPHTVESAVPEYDVRPPPPSYQEAVGQGRGEMGLERAGANGWVNIR